MAYFKHEGLRTGEFRLLHLLPQSEGEIPSCRIRLAKFADRPRYECLSYTWGSQDRPRQIFINGLLFFVTESVFGALSTLRDPKKVRTLWIDQLCINQDDDTERGRQVNLMHHIYRGAWRTAIYLHVENKPDLDFELALWPLLREVLAAQKEKRRLEAQRHGRRLRRRKTYLPAETPLSDAVREILSHPWFSRVWIVQELIISNKLLLYFRGLTCSWYSLRVYSNLVSHLVPRPWEETDTIATTRGFASSLFTYHVPQNAAFRMASLLNLEEQTGKARPYLLVPYFGKKTKGADLVKLLCTSRGFKSEDPRDRIFALLNLTSERITSKNFARREKFASPGGCSRSSTGFSDQSTISTSLRANYLKSSAQVYTEAARAVMTHDQNLRILCFVEGSPLDGAPSWVPNWTTQALFSLDKVPYPMHKRKLFTDSTVVRRKVPNAFWGPKGSLDSLQSITDDAGFCCFTDKQLILRGSILDIIEDIGDIWKGEVHDHVEATLDNWMTVFAASGAGRFQPPAQYPYPSTPEKTLWRFWEDLLVSRRLKFEDDLSSSTSNHPMRDVWFRGPYRARGSSYMPRFMRMQLPWLDWLVTSLPYASVGRRVANTRSGYLSLVPPTTQKGDVICFFEGGGAMPFVLRRSGGGYTFVGACYVHGFLTMGQPWKAPSQQIFSIE